MENKTDERSLEKLIILMEKEKLYLIKDLSLAEVAGLLDIGSRRLDRLLYDSLGMRLRQIISMYRIQHARELLMIGVKYRVLWRLSGFGSQSGMDRAFDDVVF